MQRSTHSDDGAGQPRPVLVWRFEPAVRVVSTAVLGGGLGHRSWAINAEVTRDYRRDDPAEHAAAIAAELGLVPGTGVGLLTAASVLDVASCDDGGVHCDATVGVSVPTWAASETSAEGEWVPGTINLVCYVPAPLSDAALVNAVVTATEAKTQALSELGVPGTGTASDAVLVCCPSGAAECYGGPRSTWGARLARAVHAAVAEGTERYLVGRR
ncbi:MAG: adenosylcobinamide hydrolase [Pseudonocardiales bacterium]|nr:adenosylcobinamide hydrolase [Pseudonocardiales bacterium]